MYIDSFFSFHKLSWNKISFLSVQITMNTTGIFSVLNTTTEVPKKEAFDDYKQLYIDIEWWIDTTSCIILPILGGFGNILSFIVMQRGSLREVSTCFYMSMLALADTGKYITGGFFTVFPHVYVGTGRYR